MGWDQQIDALSVYRAFEHIDYGRHKRGVRYRLALILTLIVLGKVRDDDAGRNSGVGALVSRVAERSATLQTQELSLHSDVIFMGSAYRNGKNVR